MVNSCSQRGVSCGFLIRPLTHLLRFTMPKATSKTVKPSGNRDEDGNKSTVAAGCSADAREAGCSADVDEAASQTSSVGNENFFKRDLRKFIRDSRETVRAERRRFEEAEKEADRTLANLVERRERLDREVEVKEKVLSKAIASLPSAGPKSESPEVKQKITDLRDRLRVIRKRKFHAAEAIEREMTATEENLYDCRKQYGAALTEFEAQKDKFERLALSDQTDTPMGQYSDMEYLKLAEKRPPNESSTRAEVENYEEDLRQLQLLRNIKQANENYQSYMERVGTKATGETTKRKRISGPKATDPPAKRTLVAGAPAKAREDAFEIASKKVARYVVQWLDMEGPDVDDEVTVIEESRPEATDNEKKEYVHETQLQDVLKPHSLQTPGWHAPPYASPLTGVDRYDTAALFDLLNETRLQQEMHMRIAHLHSLGIANILQSIQDLKATIVGNVHNDEQTAKLIRKANQAVMLASDPDLKRLPFRNIFDLSDYFRGPTARMEKLTLYLLQYVPFMDKAYAPALLDALIHPDLQERVNWRGGRAKSK